MSVRYLLNCTACQKQIPVEAGRAGGQAKCACGNEQEIPTIRELRNLPREEITLQEKVQRGEIPAAQWSGRQGWMLLGVLLILAGTLPALYKTWTYPQSLIATREQVEDLASVEFDRMTLTRSWELWKQHLENEPLSRELTMYEAHHDYHVAQTRQWLIVFWSLAAVGVVVLLIGLFQPGQAKR